MVKQNLSTSNAFEKRILQLFTKQDQKSKESIDLTIFKNDFGFANNKMHDAEKCLVKFLSMTSEKVRQLFEFETKVDSICTICGSKVLSESDWKTETVLTLRPTDSCNLWKNLSDMTVPQKRECSNEHCKNNEFSVEENVQYRISNNLKYLFVKVNLVSDSNRMNNRVIKGFSSVQNSLKVLQENNQPFVIRTKLAAVISHTGVKMTEGHYVIYKFHDNDWYLIDDQNICCVKSSRLPNCMKDFYLLVLQRI